MPNDPNKDAIVAALLREREAYAQQGKAGRVAEVDEQLRLRGHEVPADARREAPKDIKPRRAQQQTRVAD